MAASLTGDELLASIDNSLKLLIKLNIQQVRRDRSLKEMILELNRLGCSSTEIATYLGAKMSTVAPTVSRSQKPKTTKRKTKSGRRR
jgi:hypothetical protein